MSAMPPSASMRFASAGTQRGESTRRFPSGRRTKNEFAPNDALALFGEPAPRAPQRHAVLDLPREHALERRRAPSKPIEPVGQIARARTAAWTSSTVSGCFTTIEEPSRAMPNTDGAHCREASQSMHAVSTYQGPATFSG
jgi:hypothetical protein